MAERPAFLNARTYQLHITVARQVTVRVGRLGNFDFPPGRYVYTGSARKGMAARVARHLCSDKPCRWHIDYLLGHPDVRVTHVDYFHEDECPVNRNTPGRVVVPRFGASDCAAGCGSHLKLTTGGAG